MKQLLTAFFVLSLLAASMASAADDEGFAGVSPGRAKLAFDTFNGLTIDYPGLKTYKSGPMITRLYGRTFGTGSSAQATAERFRADYAAVFGVSSDELIAGNLSPEKRLSQPVMYDRETDSYKFTLVYYSHFHSDIPVFESELRLLVRNEADYPLTLAVSTLRDLDDFAADRGLVGVHSAAAEAAARAFMPSLTEFDEQQTVIYAGTADEVASPRMAVVFKGRSDFPEDWLFVADAVTGELLVTRDLIIFEDVVGNVSGMVTDGIGAEHCEPEVVEPFPYARVNIGSTIAYTDRDGDYTISNGGTADVTVESRTWGQWFRVYNYTGADVLLSQSVTPPGPADFMHNSLNNSESVRAQANCYVIHNEIRDSVLVHNPNYPTLQNLFPVYTNRTDGYCPGNAWYSPGEQSTNFCLSGGQYPNTAWSSVVQHEYGHHLVNVGGSGQGQYGEGMGDVMSVLMSDDPRLGLGFFGSCATSLRNADNNHQYPCSGGIHDCGQLISGCVWDTRNEMIFTEPLNYISILMNLAVNSILLHSGDLITPQITIDYLTLDDDDGNLDNGTPHYYEIAAGFGAHNMDAPELSLLLFEYPQGVPEIVAPGATATFEVVVTGQNGNEPVSGSGQLYTSLDGAPFVATAMTETSPNTYEAELVGGDCYGVINFYVSVDVQGGPTVYNPAPSQPNAAVVANSSTMAFEDDFNTNQGWVVTGNATTGDWERGIPSGGGSRGDPPSDFDGSGYCYLTQNGAGDTDIDGGTTILTSPTFDLSGAGNAAIHYARWYSNNYGAEPNSDIMEIFISDNNGSSWTIVETVGPSEEANGGWYEHTFFVTEFVTPTASMKMRFEASDLGGGSVVEAAVDDFQVISYACQTGPLAIVTLTLPDWTAEHTYDQQLVATGGVGVKHWSDKFSSLFGTGLSLTSGGLVRGSPTWPGQISLTAEVTDEASTTVEQAYEFTVNDPITVGAGSLPDWTVGQPYSQQLLAQGGTGELTFSDKNGDLAGTGLSLAGDGLLSGTPSGAGVVTFTAMATDEVGATAEESFGFTVNEAVQITTTTVPDGTQGQAYSAQIEATGGTTSLTFSDLNGDLAGSGLSISSAGLLSGTPTSFGSYSFTAHAEDVVGSGDDQPFTFQVEEAFICGDVSGNDQVDVEDVTYLVDYLFNGGPPPPVTEAADMDGSGGLPNVTDLSYLVDYLFNGGPPPVCA